MHRTTPRSASLAHLIYDLVHGGKRSVEELADLIDRHPTTLGRAADPGDPNVSFRVGWLAPLMRAQGDYTALRHIAGRCGFTVVRLPRSRRLGAEDVAAYQAHTGTCLQALHAYYEGRRSAAETLELIDQVLAEGAGFRKDVEADHTQQLLDLEDDA